MQITKRLRALLAAFIVFVLAVLAPQNIESISAHFQLDAIGVDGPPDQWRITAMSLWNGWAVPTQAYVAGPFGIGFLLGALLFSMPDVCKLVGSVRSSWVTKQRLHPGSRDGAAARELHVLKSVKLKEAFYALSGMIGGFGNMAMVSEDEDRQALIRAAMEWHGQRLDALRPSLEAGATKNQSLTDAKAELVALVSCYSSFYRDAEIFYNLAYRNIFDTSGITHWKAEHRGFVSRFREAARMPLLEDLRELADGLSLYESSMPTPKGGLALAPAGRTEPPGEVGPKGAFPDGLYVGAIHVDAQHLDKELYLDIAIQGFNASGETITIADAQGPIGYREKPDAQGKGIIDLPPATILHDRGSSRSVGNLGVIHVIVNQRVPRELAESASALLAAGHRVELDFDRWNLMVMVVGDSSRVTRLRLWNGVILGRYPDRVTTNMIAVMNAHIELGLSVT